jgi:hypothetical protein
METILTEILKELKQLREDINVGLYQVNETQRMTLEVLRYVEVVTERIEKKR